MRRRGDGAWTPLRSRLRVAALWVVAILATLDVAGAVYLRELWVARQAELSGSVRSRAARERNTDSQRASPELRSPSTR